MAPPETETEPRPADVPAHAHVEGEEHVPDHDGYLRHGHTGSAGEAILQTGLPDHRHSPDEPVEHVANHDGYAFHGHAEEDGSVVPWQGGAV
jgi:hypothetical protein